MLTLTREFLTKFRAINTRRCETIFHPVKQWDPLHWAGAMAGEFGEASAALHTVKEIFHDNQDGDMQEAKRKMTHELADFVTYLDLLCASLDVDPFDIDQHAFKRPPSLESRIFFLGIHMGVVCNQAKKIVRRRDGHAAPDDADEATCIKELRSSAVIALVHCDRIAEWYGLDLAKAVAEKFNIVSAKRGFQEVL